MKPPGFMLLSGFLLFTLTTIAGDLSKESVLVKGAYEKLLTNPSDLEIQKEYLKAFPDDFNVFLAVFMPEDFGQLYDRHDYINALFNIGTGLPRETFKKILRIETTAKWDADAVNYLQRVTLELALKYTNEFAKEFKILNPNEQKGVAGFLMDGPHGSNRRSIRLKEHLQKTGHSDIAELLQKAEKQSTQG